MKALTVKEPWASLIINGYKKYEFRSWKTNYRGKILIHSGKSIEKRNLDLYKDYNLDYSFGYIIGEVEIVDCILVDDKIQEKLLRDNKLVYGRNSHVGLYAWKFDNIVKYIDSDKLKVNGKLGLWNYNDREYKDERIN